MRRHLAVLTALVLCVRSAHAEVSTSDMHQALQTCAVHSTMTGPAGAAPSARTARVFDAGYESCAAVFAADQARQAAGDPSKSLVDAVSQALRAGR